MQNGLARHSQTGWTGEWTGETGAGQPDLVVRRGGALRRHMGRSSGQGPSAAPKQAEPVAAGLRKLGALLGADSKLLGCRMSPSLPFARIKCPIPAP